MIVAGVVLLAAAIVAFVIGLLAGSAGWLVVSLALTAAAAVLLVVQSRAARQRPTVDGPAEHDDVDDADAADVDVDETGESVPTGLAALPVWVVDGEPEYHRPHCAKLTGEDAESVPRTQAVDDGFAPCPDCTPDDAGQRTSVRTARLR